MREVKIKELMEKADISVKELEEGKVYVILVKADPTKEIENLSPGDIVKLFEPADVRIVYVTDFSEIKIFELEAKSL